jgi:hypothetical protein
MLLGMPSPGVLGCRVPGVAGISVCASTASLAARNTANTIGTVFMVLFSVRGRHPTLTTVSG